MQRIAVILASLALLNVEPCFSLVPGDKLWEVAAPLPISSSPAVAPDGTIYLGSGLSSGTSDSGALCSFSPQGTTNWILTFPRGVRSSPSIGADGTVYVGCFDSELRIVSPTGSYSKFAAGGSIAGSPAIGADGSVYFTAVSNQFNKLFALGPNRALKWVFNMTPVANPSFASVQSSSPVIGPDGTIFVGSIDTNLYAITPQGKTKWVFRLAAVTYASPSIGPDGAVYLGDDSGAFYALEPTGLGRWKVQVSGFVESSAAVSTNGTVYFGSAGGLHVFDSRGVRKWGPLESGNLVSSSPALGADGSVFIGTSSASPTFTCVSPWGTNYWQFRPANTCYSSPAVGPDGTVYFASTTKLYAFYGTNALMNSSWPMFRGNVRHTARSIQRGVHNPSILSDGNITMHFNVETGRVYHVDYSTNLVDWSQLTNFVSETFTNQFVDLTATNSSQRSYRLRTELP